LQEVPSSVTWEAAMRMIQDDYRFNALTRPHERKQAFNAYKIQKAKDEKEEYRLKARKAKEDLEKFLMTSPEMNSKLKFFR
jgi:pre-mRNA-processing factor 40